MSAGIRFQPGDRLLLATHNRGKVKEFRELLAPFELDVVSAGDLGLPEPEETGSTYEENARLKARAAADASGLPSLADDSGLDVDILGGKPGIHTARWAGPSRDFAAAMRRVEDAIQAAGASGPADRRGSFNATLCLALPGAGDMIFTGRAEGTLVWPPRGDLGFGFDPVFMPDGHDRTFGEMPSAMKHSWSPGHVGLSHRARAFARFVEACCEF